MKVYADWKSRALTLVLLIGVGLLVTSGTRALNGSDTMPIWLFFLAVIIYITTYYVANRFFVNTASGMGGYVLDELMAIPLGFVFVAKELALPLQDSWLAMIANGMIIGALVFVLAGYYYKRHPRDNKA